MKNLLKEVKGNIYGLGVYCFKDLEGKVLYVGSGMMNDRLQTHLYNLKRGKYEDTNKVILQRTYNMGNLIFEVIHFSENNCEYINGTDKERMAIQRGLEVLEQFYVDLYKDTICNCVKKIRKFSTSPNKEVSKKRKQANLGNKNPNNKYSKELMAEILWLKENDYKCKEIEDIIKNQYNTDIKSGYIWHIGIDKWIGLESKEPKWISDYIASKNEDEIFQDMMGVGL